MKAFAYIDHLLRDREQVTADLQEASQTSRNTLLCFWVFLILSVVYGFIMGSHGWMHGASGGWKFSIAGAVKLPFLFLFTLIICLPLLYVLNVLIGPRARFGVVLGLTMSSIAVTGVVLASGALILVFFMLSTRSYAFIKMLNVAIFALAGGYGVWFLGKNMHQISPPPAAARTGRQPQSGAGTIMTWWLITYAIVGTQMAWILRPFIGAPGMPFAIFRAQESNFYINVIKTLGKLMGTD